MIVNIPSHRAAAAVSWCMKHLESDTWNMKTGWPADNYTFTINNPELATLFVLKWS